MQRPQITGGGRVDISVGVAVFMAVVVVMVINVRSSEDNTPTPCTWIVEKETSPDITVTHVSHAPKELNIFHDEAYCDIMGDDWCVVSDDVCMTTNSGEFTQP